jgi:hypothetical protein
MIVREMKTCPNCRAPLVDTAGYCDNCGAPAAPVPAQPVPPAPSPYPPVAPPPAYTAGPQPPYAQAYGAGAPAPHLPPKKSRVGCIVAVILLVFLGLAGLVVALAVAGLLFFGARSVPDSAQPVVVSAPSGADGYATPEEAVMLQYAGNSEVGSKTESRTETRAVVWVGENNGEYFISYTVEKGADGLWRITSSKALEYDEDDDD